MEQAKGGIMSKPKKRTKVMIITVDQKQMLLDAGFPPSVIQQRFFVVSVASCTVRYAKAKEQS